MQFLSEFVQAFITQYSYKWILFVKLNIDIQNGTDSSFKYNTMSNVNVADSLSLSLSLTPLPLSPSLYLSLSIPLPLPPPLTPL